MEDFVGFSIFEMFLKKNSNQNWWKKMSLSLVKSFMVTASPHCQSAIATALHAETSYFEFLRFSNLTIANKKFDKKKMTMKKTHKLEKMKTTQKFEKTELFSYLKNKHLKLTKLNLAQARFSFVWKSKIYRNSKKKSQKKRSNGLVTTNKKNVEWILSPQSKKSHYRERKRRTFDIMKNQTLRTT